MYFRGEKRFCRKPHHHLHGFRLKEHNVILFHVHPSMDKYVCNDPNNSNMKGEYLASKMNEDGAAWVRGKIIDSNKGGSGCSNPLYLRKPLSEIGREF